MKIKDLSTGMKVRVELIRALLHEPEILFLDEPTRGLDPVTLRKVHNLILSLREKGMTIFLTTHNMQEASMLCDRIALLNEGSIQLTGSPENICLEYINNPEYRVVLKNGENMVFTNNNVLLSKLIAEDKILTIHTNEPTLEDVFISITGRQLV
ncbi:Fluoroquinolones export ATP-binding protein [bioreactor metagenome]|uniref:Fluoroquinolones export ATP-binding protein n=1 Tax=bioreactor metagenome TaxID=1076179 RepID=A0A645IS16_9ZZZZ